MSARESTGKMIEGCEEPWLPADPETARLLFDMSAAVIVVLDRRGRVRLVNRKACQALDCGSDDIIGKDWFHSFVPEESREWVERSYRLLMEGALTMIDNFEHPVRTSCGDTRIILWQNMLLKDPGGNCTGALCSGQDITGRRNIEQALKESEERYRRLSEISEEGIVIHRRGIIIDANRRFAQMIKRDMDDLPGSNLFDHIHPSAIDEVRQKVENNSRERYETLLLDSDGGVLHVEVSAREIDLTDGPARVAVVRDITQRKKAEAAMREAQAKYEAIFNSSMDAFFINDFEGNFVDANDSALKLLGYERDEIENLNYADLISGQTLQEALQSVQTIFEKGSDDRLRQYRLKRKDGSLVEVETTGVLIKEDGEPSLILGIARDVTEKNRMLDELEGLSEMLLVEHEKLRSMIDNMEEIVIMADEDHVIRDVNLFGLNFFSKMKDEMTGRSLEEFILSETTIDVAPMLKELKEGDKNFESFESRMLDRWMDVRVSAIRAFDGSYRGVILNLVNVTSQVEARNQAEEASLAKSMFLANISHEIRTPMNGILGFAELLKNSPLDETQARYVDTIARSGEHLLHLINQILDLSKIESGKLEIKDKPMKPAMLIQEAMEMVKPKAREKGIRIISSISRQTPDKVSGDADKILQILVNLMGNAVKFTDRGEVKIDMWMQDGRLCVSVSDTGPGISKEQQKKIFEPFQQADSGLARHHEGTGLGLAITMKLVQAMGGALELQSEPGKGSVFTLAVPVGQVEADVIELEETAETLHAPPDPAQQNVLVIDDDKSVLEIVIKMLERMGVAATGASNGTDGIYKAQLIEPDAVILDINLPDITGWQVLRELKRNPITRNIPVIIGTVQDEKKTTPKYAAAGWLTKPYSMKAISEALSSVGLKTALGQKADAPFAARLESAPLILVAEDNELNRDLIEEYLYQMPFRLEFAHNGKQCIELMKSQKPDLVLMDLAMPVMDGLEAAKIIKNDPELKNVPVVAVTAAAMPEDREKSEQAGCDHFLTKPFTRENIIAVIDKFVTGRKKDGKPSHER